MIQFYQHFSDGLKRPTSLVLGTNITSPWHRCFACPVPMFFFVSEVWMECLRFLQIWRRHFCSCWMLVKRTFHIWNWSMMHNYIGKFIDGTTRMQLICRIDRVQGNLYCMYVFFVNIFRYIYILETIGPWNQWFWRIPVTTHLSQFEHLVWQTPNPETLTQWWS